MRRAKETAIAAPILGFVLLFVWGCASASIVAAGTAYQAFGDSITYGATLTDPAKQAYPSLVAGSEKVGFTNHANTGDQACDIAPRQIFASGAQSAQSPQATYSVLIGTNDVDVRGSGAYEPIFTECHLAALAWLAIPASGKVLAGDAGFSATGPGAVDTSSGWSAWKTAGQGATVSFTVTTTQAGVLYAWVVIDDGSAATYTYALDGAAAGAASAQMQPLIATANGTTRSLSLLRLPNIAAGKHTITFTQTNPGEDGVSVAAIAAPAAGAQLPAVLAGTVPFQQHTGAGGGCQSSDAPCLAYNADIAADVSLLANDGLNVRLFDTRKYLQGTTADMSDAVHPNAQGQKELSQAVTDAWKAVR
jgi:lysophospholipase L1-like esterase